MLPSDLRVALFSGNYNYVRDGANQSLNLLVGHLLKRGVKVRIYSPTIPRPAFPPTGDLVSVPAFAVPGGRGEYKLGRWLPAVIKRDLAAFAPNLVHVSAPEFLGHRAVTWARQRDIPIVASVHTRFDTYPRYYGVGFLEPMVIWGLTRFYNRVDTALTTCQSMTDLLRDWGVTTPMRIWSRGVSHSRFNPARRDLGWRRMLGIADDEIAVGFLGRLVLEKGLGVFADVIAALERRGIKHKVLVVGEGPAREWFAERVPDAVFAGFQSGDNLGRAVASMDVFFNPSVTETFGNVTLEAMASSVPVVAAYATGTVDLVEDGETGFLIDPANIEGYAAAIARIVTEPGLRDRLGAAGHAKAERYHWDDINESALDAYIETMTRKAALRESLSPRPAFAAGASGVTEKG
ncbi:glycosyltransferase family 1 protein [Sphingomonas sp. RT2P30]|uniref:glycosyltransferase family 4 protein n=1 Tax=Parasphingomonas halimpatiens TaxID=3096162 RepID=UPI002FC766B0